MRYFGWLWRFEPNGIYQWRMSRDLKRHDVEAWDEVYGEDRLRLTTSPATSGATTTVVIVKNAA
jgi:hypothetical protein